jgi:hypothetical protein
MGAERGCGGHNALQFGDAGRDVAGASVAGHLGLQKALRVWMERQKLAGNKHAAMGRDADHTVGLVHQ